MYLDDLPIWGIVGEMDEKDFYIWTHKKFEIGYNGQQIIDVNLTSEGRTKLQLGDSVSFSYEVVWKKSTTNFEVRIWEWRFSERFGIERLMKENCTCSGTGSSTKPSNQYLYIGVLFPPKVASKSFLKMDPYLFRNGPKNPFLTMNMSDKK